MGQNIIDFVPKMGQDASDFVFKDGASHTNTVTKMGQKQNLYSYNQLIYKLDDLLCTDSIVHRKSSNRLISSSIISRRMQLQSVLSSSDNDFCIFRWKHLPH